MLALRRVSKRYRTRSGEKVVLDDVTIEFPAHENIGILGRNGAGKSTLLRLLGGSEMPDSGRILTSGRVSSPIGFKGGLHKQLTAEENCRFVARIYGEDSARVIEETQEFADIGQYFHMPVKTYSSGMRARVAFGLSMAIDFDVYLVDEVTAVGDKNFQKKCRAAFAERSAHSSVIIVSHNLKTIRSYCERCAVLHDGQLVLYDNLEDAHAAYERAAA